MSVSVHVSVIVYIGGIVYNPNEDLKYGEAIEESYFFFNH